MSHTSAYAQHVNTVPPPSAPGVSGILPGQQAVNTTRVLSLTGFSKDLKTRDIQAIFVDYEEDRGGYRIKWLDDTGCLIVFNDPMTAKRAFLALTANPHPHLMPIISSEDGSASVVPKLSPYTGDDVPTVVSSVATRPRSRSIAQNNGAANSTTSAPSGPGTASTHHRRMSNSNGSRSFGRGASMGQYQMQAIMDEAKASPAKSAAALPATSENKSSDGTDTPPSPPKAATANSSGGAIDWTVYQQQALAATQATRPRAASGTSSGGQALGGVPKYSPPVSPERGLGTRAGATSPSALRRLVSAQRS